MSINPIMYIQGNNFGQNFQQTSQMVNSFNQNDNQGNYGQMQGFNQNMLQNSATFFNNPDPNAYNFVNNFPVNFNQLNQNLNVLEQMKNMNNLMQDFKRQGPNNLNNLYGKNNIQPTLFPYPQNTNPTASYVPPQSNRVNISFKSNDGTEIQIQGDPEMKVSKLVQKFKDKAGDSIKNKRIAFNYNYGDLKIYANKTLREIGMKNGDKVNVMDTGNIDGGF